MLEVVDIEYIRKMHYVEGWSIRKIGRQLGYARQTIRKALASSKVPLYELQQARLFFAIFISLFLQITVTATC